MLDDKLFYAINGLAGQSRVLDIIGIFLARYLAYVLVFVLLGFFIYNRKKYWPMIFEAGLTAFFANFVVIGLIRLFHNRMRPFLYEQTNVLLTHSTASAFPSAHATVFFAISLIVFFYNKKAGIMFFIASFLMGLARVFTGLHWPLDILGGIVAGLFSGFLMHYIFQKIIKSRQTATNS